MARKSEKRVVKRSKRKPVNSNVSLKAGKRQKSVGTSKDGGKSRTRTTVRQQRTDFNIEHDSKRNNMKQDTDTKHKDSLRQKRKQHVKTRRRTKGKHREETEMEQNAKTRRKTKGECEDEKEVVEVIDENNCV